MKKLLIILLPITFFSSQMFGEGGTAINHLTGKMEVEKMKALFEDNMYGNELLNKYENRELNDAQFLKAFGQINIFYSTPLGDTVDGQQALFLVRKSGGSLYHPVFVSLENAKKHFDKNKRAGFLIMQKTFLDFVKDTLSIYEKAPEKVGVIIEPGTFGFTLDADVLGAVIKMMVKGT